MAVVDSSVLIHLGRIGKLHLLNKFFGKIKVSMEVYVEVKEGTGASEIEEASKSWISIQASSSVQAGQFAMQEGIGKADASVIFLAIEKRDILLSNDYALIAVARSKGVECWWPTTFLIRCLEKKLLTKKEAKQILLELVESGMRLNNAVYSAILNEIDKHT